MNTALARAQAQTAEAKRDAECERRLAAAIQQANGDRDTDLARLGHAMAEAASAEQAAFRAIHFNEEKTKAAAEKKKPTARKRVFRKEAKTKKTAAAVEAVELEEDDTTGAEDTSGESSQSEDRRSRQRTKREKAKKLAKEMKTYSGGQAGGSATSPGPKLQPDTSDFAAFREMMREQSEQMHAAF
ncbi:hypothetical protein CYMTET_30560 [Cymbomonas tetramitiformis]|uniref:Uncharacterized protein n=1 Tax=Cymbomonas tetramitiformis TaxID=36881 RepID=A0AAE0FK36_9CHLO|nr:hypothetical protein CYMTET_43513 [Cymbomonas tetramitiformis]KAK3260481.1 hypothetical protein CYMTET_30560 [Cymbomonas tetramitiformis]